MFGWSSTRNRRRARESRAKNGQAHRRGPARVFTWPNALGSVFVLAAAVIAVIGEAKIDYVVGQRIDQPIYAKVNFHVEDEERTARDRLAARARAPSRYLPNDSALTYDRIRADLLRLYQTAADAETYEKYEAAVKELGWPADRNAYARLRELGERPEGAGAKLWQEWVANLPLENQYVVPEWVREPRNPPSLAEFILLRDSEGGEAVQIAHSELASQGNEKALQGIANFISRRLPGHEFRPTVEGVILQVLRRQPTLVFDQAATIAAMQAAEDATPVAMTTYERNKPLIQPGTLKPKEYELLKVHHVAYLEFLDDPSPEAKQLREERLLQRAGLIVLVVVVSGALVLYAGTFQKPLFGNLERAISSLLLAAAVLAAAQLIDFRWPQYPELLLIPALMAGSIYAIVFQTRFALGLSCILGLLVTLVARAHMPMLLTILTGTVVAVYQLDEIRTRTKLPRVGAVTAVAVMMASAASGLFEGHSVPLVLQQAFLAGVVTFAVAGLIAMLLPFIERIFHTATALTLLEWRDPTKPLLQLLAREASGTYSHSLVLGTLSEAACERIGANGLLTQVGALYHDVGKIHRPSYFTENQEGRISRHENLAPSMSLLIILGHVKDGIELAREYKLPRVLHQFIAEHHGTTVVRYFHRVASDKQPRIASGRHDREVSEADFRYGGPKPRSRESAVLMMCDSVEGAVRSLPEPTVGRIESTIEQIISDRLNDGQFDECDITLREIRLVQDSLVKSLCSIYHGRVAYPKPAKTIEEPREPERISV